MYMEIDLSRLGALRGSSISLTEEGHAIFSNGNNLDWQQCSFYERRVANSLVRLQARVRFLRLDASSGFCLLWQGGPIGCVSSSGKVVELGAAEEVKVVEVGNSTFDLSVEFYSPGDLVTIASFRSEPTPSANYVGDGKAQFAIEKLGFEIVQLEDVSYAAPLIAVDVGARYGLHYAFYQYRNVIQPIMFEPDPEGLAPLATDLANSGITNAVILPHALFNRNEVRKLHITSEPGCSSLLMPDRTVCARWPIGRLFKIERVIDVECSTYFALHMQGIAPQPDLIKVDVQGAEYEVLEGFGNLLRDCLAIELEAQTYPLYEGQKLLSELTTFLAAFDLYLTRMMPARNFGKDLVEFECWFRKSPAWLSMQRQHIRDKFRIIKMMWEI